MLYPFLAHPAVTISLEQSVYSVVEADGSVEVCAVLEGELDRFVSIQLSTMDGTASESLFCMAACLLCTARCGLLTI